MSSLVLLATTIVFCFYFFRIQMPWVSTIPLAFFVLYSADRIIGLSGWAKKYSGRKQVWQEYGWSLSWIVSMLWLIYLWQQQWFPRYSTSWLLFMINILGRAWSFRKNYTLGEHIFIHGGRATSLVLIILSIWHSPSWTWEIAILITTLRQILYRYRLHQPTKDNDKKYFLTSKEVCNHLWRYSIIGTVVLPDRGSGLVLIMAYNAIILGLYNYSTTLEIYTNQPQKVLRPRDILQGKTFHEANERHDTFWWSLLKRLYKQWRIPSWGWLQFLQCINILSLSWLLLWTGISYFQTSDISIMLWYRIGVICFIIALLATHRESYWYHRYKKIAFIIAVTALYVTMLPLGIETMHIVIISALWQIGHIGFIINGGRFLKQYNITVSDRLLWLGSIIACTAITIFFVFTLPIKTDIAFALTCIIIGLIAFLSYQAIHQINKEKST